MESEAKYILVGSFVLISSVLVIAALLWISDAGGGRNVERYTVYFRKHDLAGLQKDSDVTMKGIKVGSVESYQISSRNIEEVKATLRLDEDTPVKIDTEAIIERNLLTGLARVELVRSTQHSPPLKNVLPNESYPIIPEGRSELERIADSIPSLLEEINEMVNRVSSVFSEKNIKTVSSILKNIENVTGELSENRKRLTSVLVELEKVAGDIREVNSSMNRFVQNTDGHVGKVSAEAVNSLKRIDSAIENLDRRVAEVSKSIQSASQVFSQEITAATQSIGAAADTFSKTVEGFEDPQSIIVGPRETALGPGEKIEK